MNFIDKYSKSLLYIQIAPHNIMLRNPHSGMAISEAPQLFIAYHPEQKVLGVGAEADLTTGHSDIRIVNPFGHPRIMVSDFTSAEYLLKAYVRRMAGRFRFFAPAPMIVLHLKDDPDGGFTQVERRAFRELALGAGASRVKLYLGPDLSDAQLLSGNFSESEG
jgi:rod shape-determining protein MreB